MSDPSGGGVGGGLLAEIDITLYLHDFHNVDLFHQGWYALSTKVSTEDGTPLNPSKVFTFLPAHDESQKNPSLSWAIDEATGAFRSRLARIRYTQEEVFLKELVSFRLQADVAKGLPSSFVVEFTMLYTEKNLENPAGPKMKSLKPVATQRFRLRDVVSGVHGYIPLHFDEWHLVLCNVCAYGALVGYVQDEGRSGGANGARSPPSSRMFKPEGQRQWQRRLSSGPTGGAADGVSTPRPRGEEPSPASLEALVRGDPSELRQTPLGQDLQGYTTPDERILALHTRLVGTLRASQQKMAQLLTDLPLSLGSLSAVADMAAKEVLLRRAATKAAVAGARGGGAAGGGGGAEGSGGQAASGDVSLAGSGGGGGEGRARAARSLNFSGGAGDDAGGAGSSGGGGGGAGGGAGGAAAAEAAGAGGGQLPGARGADITDAAARDPGPRGAAGAGGPGSNRSSPRPRRPFVTAGWGAVEGGAHPAAELEASQFLEAIPRNLVSMEGDYPAMRLLHELSESRKDMGALWSAVLDLHRNFASSVMVALFRRWEADRAVEWAPFVVPGLDPSTSAGAPGFEAATSASCWLGCGAGDHEAASPGRVMMNPVPLPPSELPASVFTTPQKPPSGGGGAEEGGAGSREPPHTWPVKGKSRAQQLKDGYLVTSTGAHKATKPYGQDARLAGMLRLQRQALQGWAPASQIHELRLLDAPEYAPILSIEGLPTDELPLRDKSAARVPIRPPTDPPSARAAGGGAGESAGDFHFSANGIAAGGGGVSVDSVTLAGQREPSKTTGMGASPNGSGTSSRRNSQESWREDSGAPPQGGLGQGVELAVFVHGFQGAPTDLRLVKSHLSVMMPQLECLMSGANTGNTFDDLQVMGRRLASEVFGELQRFVDAKHPGRIHDAPSWVRLGLIRKISFVGHSIGNLIIRAALTEPELEPFLPIMHTFISISGPHLGYLYSDNAIFDVGAKLLRTVRRSVSLSQLTFTDAARMEDCYLYRLSQVPCFELFQHVVLMSSPQDRYVPYHSARVEMCAAAGLDTRRGPAFAQMLQNLLEPAIRRHRDGEAGELMRCDVNFPTAPRPSINQMLGRKAHIDFLETDNYIRIFMWCVVRELALM